MIHKIESKEFFEYHKIQIHSFLDIGAHSGRWTQNFLKLYPKAKFLMIEANDEHRGALEKIGPHIIALVGKENTESDFYVCDDKENSHGNGIYKENTNVPFTLHKKNMKTLENLIPGQRFDLIKMDVQGSELDIIQTSPDLIYNTKYLWLELQPHHYNIGAPSAGKVIGYLNEIGFEMAMTAELNLAYGSILGMDIIFVNVRNKNLKIEYDINKKTTWMGYK